MHNICLIEDDQEIAKNISQFFNRDYQFHAFTEGAKALASIPQIKPDLVLLDVNLPDLSGLEVLKKIKEQNNKLPVIILTGYISTQTAIEAMKEGAYEFITKPFTLEKLSGEIKKALSDHGAPPSNYTKTVETTEEADEIIGKSPEVVEIAKLIGQLAKTDTPILILGESGTGKELVAKAIYHNSNRREKPFITINCSSLPEVVLESELFGHEKGATASAYLRKIGKFEQAQGGTIFLDEIADTSVSMQNRILKILNEQEFERNGGEESIKADVRIIASSSKSLVDLIKEGKFRVDLFYRLKVVSIYLPPLRERKTDIPLLAGYFLKRYTKVNQKEIKSISRDALELLVKYPWPGNVRELENNIHTAVVMAKGEILLPEHFPIFSDTKDRVSFDYEKVQNDYYKIFAEVLEPIFARVVNNSQGFIYEHLLAALEKAVLEKILKHNKGNQLKSSKMMGLSRNTLRDRMAKYNLM
jgi:DNA-binding NtrC family response regulator